MPEDTPAEQPTGRELGGAPQEEDGSSFSRAFFCFSVAAARASASFSSGIMLSTLRANRSWYLAVLIKALLRKLGKPPTRSFWVYRGTRTSPSTCGEETRVGTRPHGDGRAVAGGTGELLGLG